MHRQLLQLLVLTYRVLWCVCGPVGPQRGVSVEELRDAPEVEFLTQLIPEWNLAVVQLDLVQSKLPLAARLSERDVLLAPEMFAVVSSLGRRRLLGGVVHERSVREALMSI